MAQVIRVVRTETYTYKPNLSVSEYLDAGVTNIQSALVLDKHDYEDESITLTELCDGKLPLVHTEWSIVDE